MDPRIANKFKITRKIGEASFGSIYLGLSLISNEEVAILLEPSKKESKLQQESRIYRSLQEGSGIPKLHWSGSESEMNILVLELLGPSLSSLLKYCRGSFSLKTVLMLAEQMISRVEFMHAHYYVHRDLKPDNFLIGIGKKSAVLYLIDFGLTKKFVEKYNQHILFKDGKKAVGTARYVSINTLAGFEQSRRDDIEALGYVFVYMLKGQLPWQGLPGATKEDKYRNIMKKKMTTSLEDLCLGLPSEFIIFINYAKTLRFEEKPDYSYLRRLFKELLTREGLANDSLFDWVLEQAQQGNYDSYELLLNSITRDPGQVLLFFDYFASPSNPKHSRDLVGLFLKNWLNKDQGKIWWKSFEDKSRLVRKVLMIEDNFSVTSLILLSFLSIEDQDLQVIQLFLACTNKSAILALSYYLESSRTALQVIVNHVSAILPQLFETETVLGLQVFQRSVKHLVPGGLIEDLARKVFLLVSCTTEVSAIIEIYKTIVDLISHFYENVQPHVQVLAQVITEGVFFNDSQVNSLAYECVNVLVDVEQHRKHEGHHLFNFIEGFSEQILLVLMKKIEESDDQEETLTVSSTIQGVCEIIHSKVELLLPAIGGKLKSDQDKVRVAGVYLIGSVLSSLSPEKIQSIRGEIVETIRIALANQDSRMKNASIWLILKIAENIPEVIQNNPEIFEVLYQSLNNPSKTVVDCLLEIADGEVKVPFPEKFIEKLMNIGLNTKHCNSFNVVRAIVQSLPTDSPCLVPLMNLVIPLISTNHKNLSSLSIILRACIEKLSEASVIEFYQPLMSLLVSLPLNDEYLVACSCLSRHPIFQSYISSFTTALSVAMSVKESFTSAVICISELVRNLEFSDWLPPLMPKVVKLLNLETLPNTQLLEAVTDLVSLHTLTCLQYLPEFMAYIDHCMRFSLSAYEDTEFLDELKELVVSFFEGVIQGLENVGKVELISGKVNDIIKFCLIVTQDVQDTNPNIIAGALGIFSDIAMAFNSLPEKENILKFVKQFVTNESEMVRMNAECAVKTISELD